MENKVFLVNWESGTDKGIIGIFSSMEKANHAIDEDKELYAYPDYDIDYDVESFVLDEAIQ